MELVMDSFKAKEILNQDEYHFLQSDEHLGSNVILLVVAGSIGYGTSISTSDIDLRGVTVELKRDLLGLSSFEQFQDQMTDTVIFGLKKFIHLCLKANPSALEILGAQDEFCINISPEGRLLRDNINLFLSKKIIETFGNYAAAQLVKMYEKIRAGQQLDNVRLNKHAMHVIRVLMTGTDILDGKGVIVYREEARDMLINIREGRYNIDEFQALANQLRGDFDRAAKNTQLPDFPAYDAVEELMMNIYRSKWGHL